MWARFTPDEYHLARAIQSTVMFLMMSFSYGLSSVCRRSYKRKRAVIGDIKTLHSFMVHVGGLHGLVHYLPATPSFCKRVKGQLNSN